MKTIYKYPFSIDDSFSIDIPETSKILRIALDPTNIPCVWVALDTSDKVVTKKFIIKGTGHNITKVGEYITSFNQGCFVWHVFHALTI